MPRTKKNPNSPPRLVSQAAGGNGPLGEVLTLGETAAYLRVNESDVLQLVHEQRLPGRQLGREWRFLKAALQDWLRTGTPAAQSNKDAWMALAGAWKDDPYVEEELKEIYRQRGRPMTEDEG